MTAYDIVLFDNDGVLVEPPANATQVAATRKAFRTVGVDEPLEAHVTAIVEGVTIERLEAICRHYDLDPKRFWAAREDADEQSQLSAFRAGDRTRYPDVTAIAELDHPRAVVSNNHHSTIAFVMQFFDLEEWFDSYRGRPKTIASLGRKKPAPDYLQDLLDELETTSALYVGDSQSDVIAARRAGIDSAFVRRPHCRDISLDPTPTYDVNDLHAVVDIVTA